MFGINKNTNFAKLLLPGLEQSWQWQGQRVTYSTMGEGAPLLFLHGINAAAWGIDFRQNIEPIAQQYKVFVPDLPGFGRSERRKMAYNAEMYISFITDFARFITESEGEAPAIIVNSLTAAHLIAAATRTPEYFGAIILVCPTGLEKLDFPPTQTSKRLFKLFSGPVGTGLFWLLTGRRSTRIFLGRDAYFAKESIDTEIVESYHRSARQPNAKYAPFSFITFNFNHSVKEEWPNLTQPALIVWGREAIITPLANADAFLELCPETELVVIEQARLSVQDERPEEFNRLALKWLASHSFSQEPEPLVA
jgi:pimeloyl-ACP methyl ester carboxylesterase